MNRTDTRMIGRIAPVTDDEAARLVSPGALADLGAQITASPASRAELAGPAVPARGNANIPRRRTRAVLAAAIAVPVAAAGIVGGLLATSTPATTPGTRPGTSLPPAAARALSFTVRHGYIDVIVRNPYADPSWYNADFRAHRLDITLRMRPVSPSIVGTVIFTDASSSAVESEITMIYARCPDAPSGGHQCAVGIRVPLGFRGQYEVDFGRAARPGEQYVTTNSAFAHGEVLHGMKYIVGRPVPAVLAEIGKRHLTAILNDHNTFGPPGKFSGTWYVTDAVPYAPGQVMLFVSRSSGAPLSPAPAKR